MTPDDLELARVADWLREEADAQAPPTYLDTVLTTTSRTPQIATWRRAWRSSSLWIESVLRRQPSIVWAGIVVVLLVGSLAIVSAWPRPTVHNGVLALAADDGLYLADADGATPQRVGGPLELSRRSWSPDGSRLLATSASGALVALDDRGERLGALTGEAYAVEDAAWSPDGSRIVLSADDPTLAGGPRLYTMDADGSDVQPFLAVDDAPGSRSHVLGEQPTWSPDGRWIAFVHQRTELWVVHAEGSERTLLSDAGSAGRGSISSVSWSPDSARLEYLRGDPDGDGPGVAAVHVLSLAGGDERPISTGGGQPDSPVWSPDGTRIAWLEVEPLGTRLIVFDVATEQTTAIATGASLQGGWLVWSPDGAWLAAATTDARGYALIAVDGSRPDRSVSVGSRIRGAAWQSA